MKILAVSDKKEAKFLRQKTALIDFIHSKKSELRQLIREMRQAMKKADGVGLSANQVGKSLRLFVAEVPAGAKGKENKFYTIINPEIVKASEETTNLEEGCLSVPETFGLVERPEKITITGLDMNGRKIKIKAWGLLARVFQHEVDHLNGILFIDKAKDIKTVPSKSTNSGSRQ